MQYRELMPKILIEGLSFPSKEIEYIQFKQGNTISIRLSDMTLNNNTQYQKWINLCGTMDMTPVEQVSIGKIHYDTKFLFHCNCNIGIPGKTASGITINLIPENVSLHKDKFHSNEK